MKEKQEKEKKGKIKKSSNDKEKKRSVRKKQEIGIKVGIFKGYKDMKRVKIK